MGGSLFASCCGLLSRFERGGRRPLYVRCCHRDRPLGVVLVGATARGPLDFLSNSWGR